MEGLEGCSGCRFPFRRALAVAARRVGRGVIGGGGLWKSIDGAASWRNVFPGNVYALAINPRNPMTIYAGAHDGLERSTDGGLNWTMIPRSPGLVSVLALDPQNPDTVYAGGQGGLFAITFSRHPGPHDPRRP